jgi:hypothetical protein
LHSGAIALELYLKAWSAKQVEVDAGSGVGIVVVRARATVPNHELVKLLSATPNEFRAALSPLLEPLGGAAAALESLDGLFEASRYPYEEHQDITCFRTDDIAACIQALTEATKSAGPLFLPP